MMIITTPERVKFNKVMIEFSVEIISTMRRQIAKGLTRSEVEDSNAHNATTCVEGNGVFFEF